MTTDPTVTLVRSLFPDGQIANLVRAARAACMFFNLRAVPPACSICLVAQRTAPSVPDAGHHTYQFEGRYLTVCDHHARRKLRWDALVAESKTAESK